MEYCTIKGRGHYKLPCETCNKQMIVRIDYIERHSKSCLSCTKMGNTQAKKHGDYKNRLYKIWQGLSHRRYKSGQPEICKEWSDYLNFKNWSVNNGYNDNLTIDRIDNKLGYYPENCQWITIQINAAKDKIIFTNLEKINIYKERKMLKLTQRQYAEKLNVSKTTIGRAEKYAKNILNGEKNENLHTNE